MSKDEFVLRQWLDLWRQCYELADDDIPDSLHDEIVAPFKKGDPVFSTNVAKELINAPLSDQLARILSIQSHSTKRILMCEIIFNICKCTNHECRLFVASQLPVLLWLEWTMPRDDLELDEDLGAIEIALLAAFQQDLNIESSLLQVRVPSLAEPSIYHQTTNKDVDSRNIYPWKNESKKTITSDPSMYPTRPITKIDEYSRTIVVYRLSRFLQDNLPSLPTITKITYYVLLERLTSMGTSIDSVDTTFSHLDMLASQWSCPTELLTESSSMLEMEMQSMSLDAIADPSNPRPTALLPVERIDVVWLGKLFKISSKLGKFPAAAPLYVLWTEVIPVIQFQFPALAKLVKKQLLRRAKSELLPLVVLALQ